MERTRDERAEAGGLEHRPDPRAEVLLTGATGFLGKVVLHELLRRREELCVERVHVLVRARRRKDTPETRFASEILASPCFARLPEGWQQHVSLVAGDLERDDCGIDAATRARLAGSVTRLVHCAASVEFDLPVRRAAQANVTCALNVLELARTLPLAALVDVSTAYVTPHPGDDVVVEERLAPLHRSAAALYEGIAAGRYDTADDEAGLLAETGHPNTYTLTKCLAEHLLCERRGTLPLRFVRPSVITASLHQPFPGWLDSPAAFAVFAMMIGSGRMRAVMARKKSRIDLVPVDVVADRVIGAAFAPQEPGEPPILHAVAGYEHSPSLRTCQERVPVFFERNPVQGAPPARLRYLGPDGPLYRLAHWLQHHRRPESAAIADRIADTNQRFAYFTCNTFRFRSSAPLDVPGFDPGDYLDTTCRGVYRHLLGGDKREVTIAGREHRRQDADVVWVLRQPRGNAFIRLAGYLVDKALARCVERVTIDVDSFREALEVVPEGATVVLAPSHRSYLDFVLCSYLCFARPDLGITIPHIAAAVEFARIPLLGWLFRRMHAFYLERGKGREDKRLTRQVDELVRAGVALEFFIEGQRSRSRRFLPPRRGLLRSLQATGHTCALLPIAISYDRVPEEASFARELAGAPKPPMRLRDLLGWTRGLLRGEVALGRVHVACGRPSTLDLTRDVRDVSREVVSELQRTTVATSYHLKSFLDAAPDAAGLDVEWLREAITRRGGRVLDVPAGTPPAPERIERSFRHHFQHLFYPEAALVFAGNPAVESCIRRSGFSPAAPVELEAELADERVQRLVHALFDPVCRDYAAAAEALADRSGAPAPTPRSLLASPGAGMHHLPDVEDAFADLAERGLLVGDAAGGFSAAAAHAAELDAYREACLAGLDAKDPT